MKITPHQYQVNASNAIQQMLQQQNVVLLQSPIASGKTYIAADITNKWLTGKPQDRILIIVNRITLILQTYETLTLFRDDHVIAHGEIRKDLDGGSIRNIVKLKSKKIVGVTNETPSILITTSETFKNLYKHMPNYYPNLIIIDEAHKATSEGYQYIKKEFPGAKILGLTATPFRAASKEGECLYEDWYGNNVVETISIKELIQLGQLVQPRYIQYSKTDHVCRTWQELTKNEKNKRTLVFCDDTLHAMKMLDAFKEFGVSSDIITTSDNICDDATSMTVKQRNEIYRKFRDGEIDVLISIMALCEGFNEPKARYGFLCRNFGGETDFNPAFYTQAVGRVLRQAPGKKDAIIVDFYGNIDRYGKVEDWDWDITDQGNQQTKSVEDGDRVLEKDYSKRRRIYVTCKYCAHVYNLKETTTCIHCGKSNSITLCSSSAELYKVDEWIQYRKDTGWKKEGKAKGLYDLYNVWLKINGIDINIDFSKFGECMTELVSMKKLDKHNRRGVWYIPK